MLDFISIEHCRLIVQTLGHSLWQASLIAMVCWFVLRSLPASRTSLRYGVACAGLLLVVAATLGTSVLLSERLAPKTVQFTEHTRIRAFEDPKTVEWFKQRIENSAPTDQHASHADLDSASQSQRILPSRQPSATASRSSDITWPTVVAGLWASGVLLMFGRVGRQLLAVRQLLTPSGTFDCELLADLKRVVDELATRLKLRFPVRLVVSDRVSVPGVIGTFWPVLLLPPAMLSGVPIEQLRIIIAHELAHARRFDFLVNLGQLIVESLLFFNPAVWWLSRQIRIEREACCDAAAVSATGSPVPVARTLLAIVEQVRESLDAPAADRFAAAAGVQSFAGHNPDGDNSPLFDRVRRIVTPELRPHVRVPWYTLLGVVAAYGLVSFGLYEGTAVTVHAVQQALTPKERVEKIEKLIAEKGELARSEGMPVGTSFVRRDETPSMVDVTVSGVIRAHDGNAIPAGLRLSGLTFRRTSWDSRSAETSFTEYFSESAKEFDFEGRVRCFENTYDGTVSLFVYLDPDKLSPGFAPLVAGPIDLVAGESASRLELTLQPGFDANLSVVTEDGDPVPGAFVASGYFVGQGGSGFNLQMADWITNESGQFIMPHSTSHVLWRCKVRAAGFQSRHVDLTLKPGNSNLVVLKKSQPTRLVLTTDTGEPVSGANAFLLTEAGPSHTWMLPDPRNSSPQGYAGRNAPLYQYGPSDGSGTLVLDALAGDTKYDLLILHDQFGPFTLTDVEAGVASIPVTLRQPLSVSGRVLGDLSRLDLDRRSKRPYFRYHGPASHDYLQVFVDERDGEGHFEITGLSRGKLTVRLPDRYVIRNLTESIDDLVIDLNQAGSSLPTRVLPVPEGASRKVVLRLTGADESAPVTGKLVVGYLTRGTTKGYSTADLDIVDGRVEFDVEVPTKIHWVDRSFTGYSVVGRTGVEVGTGDEPFRLNIPLLPGGAVRGEVRLADGSLPRDFHVDLRPVDQTSKYKGADDDIDQSDPPGEFVLTGVPFDQKFRLLVTDGRIRSVAAIVSEPFSLSAAEPIADLKFQFAQGQTHVIRLLDENGAAAIGAKAEFAFNPGLGFVRSHGWKVNDDATVVFEHVSDSIPGETTFQVEAAGPYRGQKLKLDWSNLPETLTLQRGVAAEGRIIDEATGRGVAGARFFLFPQPPKAAEFRDAVWGETDDEGRFSFECLEPVTYQLNLHGAVPPRVPFKKNALGVLEPDYSNIKDGTFPEWFVRGGSPDEHMLTVKRTPDSHLKLAEPAAGR
jgi:beta-lactamase regulating signal transducer with metallopeptidase domain